MKSFIDKILSRGNVDHVVTIVSGLPRSGTSMMMQMLEAGGMPVLTDHIRKADEDNPRGYYEFEKAKKIEEDSSWLKNARGKTLKMVSALIYHLPSNENYRVIFMRRDMEEVLQSQAAMLMRLGNQGAGVSKAKMRASFQAHLKGLEAWLSRQGHIEVLYVNYNDVVSDPHGSSVIVNSFLRGKLHIQKMAGAVEASLYKKRKKEISL